MNTFKISSTIVGIVSAISLLFLSQSIFAASSQEKAIRIISEAIERDNGFGSSEVDMEMILTNAHGQKSTRLVRTKSLEVEGDGDKLLTIFDRPRDVKGTALLAVTHKTKSDDQWLYLPALKRVKRISSSNRSGSFMGSEFAFEDLASEEVEKYKSYEFLKEEKCGQLSCYVISRVPVDKKSGYKRQIVWIDTTHYRFMKTDYYDRKNELLKTRQFNNYKQYLNKFWRASEIIMTNHQSGKNTVLQFKNIRFQTGLTDRDFDRNALKRAR